MESAALGTAARSGIEITLSSIIDDPRRVGPTGKGWIGPEMALFYSKDRLEMR